MVLLTQPHTRAVWCWGERRGLGLLLWRVGSEEIRGRAHSLAGVIAPRCPGARPADFIFQDTR